MKNLSDCIFCKISHGEIPSKRIYENDNFFSVHDVNPKAKGHSLVISKKHFENILELPSTLGTELIDCIKKTTMKLMSEDKTITGFNVVGNNFPDAGQIVKHFHVHILPRRKNDNIRMIV